MSNVLPKPSPRCAALLSLLRSAETIWQASRRLFAHWDLSPSQFNLLNELAQAPQGLSQIELSRLLIMHRSNVTGLLDRLEARGLVERRPDAADRRAYLVVLTAAGRALWAEILPEYYAAAERVWGDIPAARARELAAKVGQVSANAGELAARFSPGL